MRLVEEGVKGDVIVEGELRLDLWPMDLGIP